MGKRRAPELMTAAPWAEEVRSDWLYFAGQLVLIAKIAFTIIVFDPRSFDAFSLPKSAFGNALSLVLGLVLVVLVARYGRRILVWSPLHLAVGALVVLFALASLFALDRQVAVFGLARRFLGLSQMLDDAVLYLGAVVLFRSTRDLARLGVGLLAAVAFVALYAFVQLFGLDIVTYTEGTARPIATFGNQALSGAFFSIAAAGLLGCLALLFGALPQWARASLAVLGGVCLILLLATGERAGILSLGAAGVVVGLIRLARVDWRRTAPVLGGTVAIFAVALAFSPIGSRLATISADDPGLVSRLDVWQAAAGAIASRPILGVGPDNFAAAYPPLRLERGALGQGAEVLQTSTHDWLLYAATSAGVPGGIAMIVAVSLALVAGFRLARQGAPAGIAVVPLAAYLGQGLVNVNDVSLDWIFWCAAGIISGASGSALMIRRRVLSVTPLPRAAGVAVLMAIVALSLALAYQRIRPAEAMFEAEALSAAGRGREAVAFARQAVELDDRRAVYWGTLGTALSTSGNAIAANAALATAARLEPWQPLYWRDIGITRLAVGDDSGARAALERAVSTDRFDRDAWDLLARISVNRGEFQRARDEGLRAVRLIPEVGSTYESAIIADINLKNWTEAEQLVNEALDRFSYPRLRVLRAEVLAGTGRTAEAIGIVNDVLAVDPNNAEAQALLVRLRGR